MLVPAWAERGGRGTAWHPEHISERYGLFTLIVLGECVEAATVAMQSADSPGLSAGAARAWRPAASCSSSRCGGGTSSTRPRRRSACPAILAFLWGYAHYVVFASVAALGAGLEVGRREHPPGEWGLAHDGRATVAISVAVYLVVTGCRAGAARTRPRSSRPASSSPFAV